MDDIDDNDYITAEDMEQHYEDMCGGDLTFMKGECIFVIGGSFWIGLNSSSDISIWKTLWLVNLIPLLGLRFLAKLALQASRVLECLDIGEVY